MPLKPKETPGNFAKFGESLLKNPKWHSSLPDDNFRHFIPEIVRMLVRIGEIAHGALMWSLKFDLDMVSLVHC